MADHPVAIEISSPVIEALAQANLREMLIGRNIEVKEEAFAPLPIQAQKSNSRVLNFDSQSSRRCADSNPWPRHVLCAGGFEPSDPRITAWYKSGHSEIRVGIWHTYVFDFTVFWCAKRIRISALTICN
jgi:hypothetical protein